MASGKTKYKVAKWYNLRKDENTPPEGTAMFQLTAIDKLDFEFFPGKIPEEVEDFTNNVKHYER